MALASVPTMLHNAAFPERGPRKSLTPQTWSAFLQAAYCTAMFAVLLVTVPSADLTIRETLLPVGAACGIVRLIWTTPGNPGA